MAVVDLQLEVQESVQLGPRVKDDLAALIQMNDSFPMLKYVTLVLGLHFDFVEAQAVSVGVNDVLEHPVYKSDRFPVDCFADTGDQIVEIDNPEDCNLLVQFVRLVHELRSNHQELELYHIEAHEKAGVHVPVVVRLDYSEVGPLLALAWQ